MTEDTLSYMLNEYEKQLECKYKGEIYSVRDNGAVLRHHPEGNKPRKLDDTWTFGKYDIKTGYARIGGEPVHRIVATAFLGKPPSSQHVVDHIDTNRRNNRPENLRWVTKLENALLNPITAKKIEYICGSIEEFLKDPSKLRKGATGPNFDWMRAVSKEEASISLARLTSWAKSDKPSSGGSLGEWVYKRGNRSIEPDKSIVSVSEKKDPELKSVTVKISEREKPQRILKSNPFNFPRATDVNDDTIKMYKGASKLFLLIKSMLEGDKKIKLPAVLIPTAGKGITIKEPCIFEFEKIDYLFEAKSRIPKYILLDSNDNHIAVVLFTKSKDKTEDSVLHDKGYNIFEIDLSWASHGVTNDEMKYILQEDVTKKKWIFHKQISDEKEKLQSICENIEYSGTGVLHSYIACPQISDSIQDTECWYCDYHIYEKDISKDNEKLCEYCFGKSGVKTYNDLMSIVDVTKENGRITAITFNRDGNVITENFEEHVQLPGKTILQLWEEKTDTKLVAHNIYSEWYVLIEDDPKESIRKTGNVYGKLARSIEQLKTSKMRTIFSFDDKCWVIV